jgi:ssRNA-specific RNase YbeY (16S rRNA maturation enzyme)
MNGENGCNSKKEKLKALERVILNKKKSSRNSKLVLKVIIIDDQGIPKKNFFFHSTSVTNVFTFFANLI